MALDTDQYRQLFIEEAKEHIDTITKSMLILEKEPENQEVINMLFRSAHTLKGSSGMMGFKDFQELTHAMEDVFDDMRKGNQPSCSSLAHFWNVLMHCHFDWRTYNTKLKVTLKLIYSKVNFN